MKALVQRVRSASVESPGTGTVAIGRGLVVLLGVARGDGPDEAHQLAGKTADLRIFEDGQGKMNLSLRETGGEALVVSQFTLLADTSRGNRPGFEAAAPPEEAEELYRIYVEALSARGIPVRTGTFRARMLVNIANDGPVTILLERGRKNL